MKVEPDIRPLWKLDNRYLRYNRRDELHDKMLEIVSLIATCRTFRFVPIKEIQDKLPGFEYGFDQNIEFHPGTESLSIIRNPSPHHKFNRFYITE